MRLLASLVLLQAFISVNTELVTVPVTVTDGRGRHIAGLTLENFRVFEDGQPQPIAVFHHGDAPVTLGLIVDRSQSMRPKSSALALTLSTLLQSGRAGDELFAVNFNDRVSLALPSGRAFTNDTHELNAALTAVRAEGRTALYDGVAEGLRHLQRGQAGRHVLIVVSDGGDNASMQTYAQVRALARESDAVIYAIGLMGVGPVEEDEDGGLLERLCRETGGAAYFPRTTSAVASEAMQVARDLREQYTLGFAPGPQIGTRVFRRIEVKVATSQRGRLHVRTRAGYSVAAGKP